MHFYSHKLGDRIETRRMGRSYRVVKSRITETEGVSGDNLL